MVTICLKCGDKGWSVALIYCEKCQTYAVHHYCLDILPPTFDEDVTWFCEDCKQEPVKPIIVQSTRPQIKSKKRPRNRGWSRSKKKRNRKRKEITDSVATTNMPKCEPSPSLQLVEVDCHENFDIVQKLGSDEEDEYVKTRNSEIASNEIFYIEHPVSVRAQPIIDPIWRGNFSFCHKSLNNIGGLVAHLSSFACPKVCDEANLLPELICLDVLPRFDVWPKNFIETGPSDENIALYFFPDNERDEKAFDSLVDEMILQDLSMRAVVENGELLVFTSKLLPLLDWRFQAKFYLWGVFRNKQASETSNEGIREERDFKKAKTSKEDKDFNKDETFNRLSPISPLSNGGSCGSGPSSSVHSLVLL